MQLALANTPTSQRANEPTTSSLTGRTVTSSGPYLSKTPTSHDSRVTSYDPYSIPGSNVCCAGAAVRASTPRHVHSPQSTVHSSQSIVQGSESSPPNRKAGKSLRRNPDAVTSCERTSTSTAQTSRPSRPSRPGPWPTGNQTPNTKHPAPSRVVNSLPANRTQHPGAAYTTRLSAAPSSDLPCIVYRVDLDLDLNLRLRLNWPGQCTVTGVRSSRRFCVALRRGVCWIAAADVCILGMRIGEFRIRCGWYNLNVLVG